jgi:cold shock CspA family protein
LTIIAILAVARASAAGGDVAANCVAALAALAALVALSSMSDGGGDSSAQRESNSQSEKEAQDRVYAELLNHENRGIVKRFSERNGWGLISCEIGETGEEVSATAPDSRNPGQPRRDVRFYRQDAEASSLNVGDVVWFRAEKDEDAPGWLRAVSIQREASIGDSATKPQTTLAAEIASRDSEDTRHIEQTTSQGSMIDDSNREDSAPSVDGLGKGESERQRPATTPVVARRLVHQHLEVPLGAEHRAEEREFWSGSPQKKDATTSQREEEAPAVAPPPVKPVRRQPLATLRAATGQDGLPLLVVAAAAAGKDTALT